MRFIYCIDDFFILVFSSLYSVHAEVENMKKYFDPGQKFSLVYPAHWFARGTHDSITGTTEIKLVILIQQDSPFRCYTVQMIHYFILRLASL